MNNHNSHHFFSLTPHHQRRSSFSEEDYFALLSILSEQDSDLSTNPDTSNNTSLSNSTYPFDEGLSSEDFYQASLIFSEKAEPKTDISLPQTTNRESKKRRLSATMASPAAVLSTSNKMVSLNLQCSFEAINSQMQSFSPLTVFAVTMHQSLSENITQFNSRPKDWVRLDANAPIRYLSKAIESMPERTYLLIHSSLNQDGMVLIQNMPSKTVLLLDINAIGQDAVAIIHQLPSKTELGFDATYLQNKIGLFAKAIPVGSGAYLHSSLSKAQIINAVKEIGFNRTIRPDIWMNQQQLNTIAQHLNIGTTLIYSRYTPRVYLESLRAHMPAHSVLIDEACEVVDASDMAQSSMQVIR